jgi:hypothetical protein
MTLPKENHFTKLARDGAELNSSPSQIAARELARALIKHAPLLDGPACAGMMDFIGYVRKNPAIAREWLGDMPHPVACEHGVPDGDWCEPCNQAYKAAALEQG